MTEEEKRKNFLRMLREYVVEHQKKVAARKKMDSLSGEIRQASCDDLLPVDTASVVVQTPGGRFHVDVPMIQFLLNIGHLSITVTRIDLEDETR